MALTHRMRRRLLRGLLVATAVALPLAMLRGTAPFEMAEAKAFDLRTQWTADPGAASQDIALVAIDDNSLEVYREALGRWPWPREVYAAIIDYLEAAGARLIVFDILFQEPDRAQPDSDAAFAEAIRSGLVVLPMTFSPGDDMEAREWERLRDEEQEGAREGRDLMAGFALGPAPEEPDLSSAYVEPPAADFVRGAAGLGSVTLNADRDGVVRRDRLVYAYREELYPSLPLAAARLLKPDTFGGQVSIEPRELHSGSVRIPLIDHDMLIRWRGPFVDDGRATYPVYPAFHVLNSYEQLRTGLRPDVPLAAFEGKIVFVALTGIGLFDARVTPLRPHDPGVIIHMSVLDNLLSGNFLQRAPAAANMVLLVAVILGVALLASVVGSAALAGAGVMLLLLLLVAGTTLAFGQGIWIDLATPWLGGVLGLAAAMGANYVAEGREKARVREMFGRYVSPEYVRQLADNPEGLSLGGSRVPLTVLFSDIRGFTALSERLPAETVVEVLNEYLEAMTKVVFRHGGTLDKFIGDAVMAFWGAPLPVEDHARRALDTALDMLTELDALNERWKQHGSDVEMRIGIGINTGEAIVGNIGSLTHKLDFTAIGDTVNLASRLEGLNKEFGTSILISDATRNAAGQDYAYLPRGATQVKGKMQAVEIFEVREASPPRRGSVGGALAAALFAVVALAMSPVAEAQEVGQWNAWIYQPFGTSADSLALAARADLYARPPRWRAEIQLAGGAASGETLVLVGSGRDISVLTPVGATPLAEHAAAGNPVVQAVIAQFDGGGRLRSRTSERLIERAEGGRVEWVALRRQVARTEVRDELFETSRGRTLGRRALATGIHAVGGERRQQVVASAGARGVSRVQTVDGEVTVTPNEEAVRAMQRTEVDIVELDQFMREGNVGAHTAPLLDLEDDR